MDPNAALKELRELLEELEEDAEYPPIHTVHELFNGLDEWLSKGGFLPDDWNKERKQ